jgi:hypothetical protein
MNLNFLGSQPLALLATIVSACNQGSSEFKSTHDAQAATADCARPVVASVFGHVRAGNDGVHVRLAISGDGVSQPC